MRVRDGLRLLVLCVFLAGPGARAAPEPIRIGIITSLSGSFATFGAMEVAGYKVAAAEVNEKGGVLGRPIELLAGSAVAMPFAAERFHAVLARADIRSNSHPAMLRSALLNVMIKAAQKASRALKRDFGHVKHVKPAASRADSAELYLLATGFRGHL